MAIIPSSLCRTIPVKNFVGRARGLFIAKGRAGDVRQELIVANLAIELRQVNEIDGHGSIILQNVHTLERKINKGPTTDGRLLGAPGLLDTTTPSAIMSKREEFDKLAKAIDTLKPEYREVIILAKIEGFSYKEIAAKLGKSSDAVRKLASRAMTALIGAYEEI